MHLLIVAVSIVLAVKFIGLAGKKMGIAIVAPVLAVLLVVLMFPVARFGDDGSRVFAPVRFINWFVQDSMGNYTGRMLRL